MNEPGGSINFRLAEIRKQHFGPRGKARFARELGILPTTYHHYEIDRTPPAEFLVRAARATGTSLVWLLTGEGEMTETAAPVLDGDADPLLGRIRQLLARRPELSRSLRGFVELLEEVAATLPAAAEADESLRTDHLVPVVGGTAAGPARFWNEIERSATLGAEINSRLEEALRRHSVRAVRQAGVAPTGSSETAPVSLVQLSRPDELGFVEFLSCPSVKEKHPTALGWRIDGDSMAPRYVDGDIVIVSPDESAIDGYPCVAHQKGQIGVNCKIYSRAGEDVLLVPLNESFQPQRLRASDILWAYRVLYAVRLRDRR